MNQIERDRLDQVLAAMLFEVHLLLVTMIGKNHILPTEEQTSAVLSSQNFRKQLTELKVLA